MKGRVLIRVEDEYGEALELCRHSDGEFTVTVSVDDDSDSCGMILTAANAVRLRDAITEAIGGDTL
jgi:hypothetical protein